MKIDVTQIPNLNTEGFIKTDSNGNLSVESSTGLGDNQSEILYLDANEYTGTPEKGNPRKPYQSHAAALAAASDGDVIWVIGAHTTTIPLHKDGVAITYYRPTVEDGIEFTPNFQSMIFTGADTDGTKVYLLGDGFTRATGLAGPPCVYMTGNTNISDEFVVKGGTFEPNANVLLLGGNGCKFHFSPRKTEINQDFGGSVFSGSPETSGSGYIGDFQFEINAQINNCNLLSTSYGGVDSILYIQNINIYSTVTQVATSGNILLQPDSNSPIGTRIIGNINCQIENVDLFYSLTTSPVEPYKLHLNGNIYTTGNRNTGTAVDSDFSFEGTGIIKTADKEYLIGGARIGLEDDAEGVKYKVRPSFFNDPYLIDKEYLEANFEALLEQALENNPPPTGGNLFTNQYFVDSNSDGLADGVLIVNATNTTMSIETISGVNGNVQKAFIDSVEAVSPWMSIPASGIDTLTAGDYTITFKYRNTGSLTAGNSSFLYINDGNLNQKILPKTTGAGMVEITHTITSNGDGLSDFRFYIGGTEAGGFLQIADLVVTKIDFKVKLPTEIDAVVGDTLQLFFNSMVDVPNYGSYHFSCDYEDSAQSTHTNRYFETTPTVAGDYILNVKIYDSGFNELGSASTTIVVKDSVQQPASLTNAWLIGDSLTSGTAWITELDRRLTGTGGTPAGDNYGNISIHAEGNSGKQWNWYVTDEASPFVYSGVVDFEQYRIDNGLAVPQVAYILLTWNGMGSNRSATEWALWDDDVYTFIDDIKAAFPSIEIKLMSPPMPSTNGGLGYNYGNQGFDSYSDLFTQKMNSNTQSEIYDRISKEGGYSAYVEHIKTSLQVDSEYNMPTTVKDVNTRNSSITETIGTNGVHPATSGYYQIADAAYRNFIKNYCQ